MGAQGGRARLLPRLHKVPANLPAGSLHARPAAMGEGARGAACGEHKSFTMQKTAGGAPGQARNRLLTALYRRTDTQTHNTRTRTQPSPLMHKQLSSWTQRTCRAAPPARP